MPTFDPVFTQTIKTASAVATAAKTTYSDATNAVVLYTAPAGGAVLYKLTALPRATVTASQLQLYRLRAGVYSLIGMATMSAYTMAQTTSPTPTDFGFTESAPLRVEALDVLYIATGVALAGGIVFDAQLEEPGA
jgi:hypothetical protein